MITMTTASWKTHTAAIWYLTSTIQEIHTHKLQTLHMTQFMAQQDQQDQWDHKETEDLRDIRAHKETLVIQEGKDPQDQKVAWEIKDLKEHQERLDQLDQLEKLELEVCVEIRDQ